MLLAFSEQLLPVGATSTKISDTTSWDHLDEYLLGSQSSATTFIPPDNVDLNEVYFSEEDEHIEPFIDEANVFNAFDMISDEDGIATKDSPRKLSAATAAIGDFYALDCNAGLDSQPCTNLDISGDIAGNLEIGCGECKLWNNPEVDVTIGGGINILGKLLFPTNHRVTIRTKYVIVQGEVRLFTLQNIFYYLNHILNVDTHVLSLFYSRIA